MYFLDVEMPIVKPLTLMELNGFGLDSTELERLKKILEFEATGSLDIDNWLI